MLPTDSALQRTSVCSRQSLVLLAPVDSVRMRSKNGAHRVHVQNDHLADGFLVAAG
jgi:hypothetical protein